MHLDEMNIAAQLRTDRRCPDCGEPSPLGVLLDRCGSQEEDAAELPGFRIGCSIERRG